MSHRHISVVFKRLLITISALISVNGCLSLPENSKQYQYEIDITAHGQHYAFQQYFSCHQQPNLSEAGANLHPTMLSTGVGTTAADIGDNFVLLFQVGACIADGRKEMPREAYVLVNSINPDRIYWINEASEDPSIIINHITVKSVQGIYRGLGPTPEQRALKETVRNHQHGFQSVTAQIIPPEEWATSDQSRAYFEQFHSVTIAKVGEAERLGWRPDGAVLFKFWGERSRKSRLAGAMTSSEQIQLEYNGSAFDIPDHHRPSTTVWYSTVQTRNDHPNPNKAPEYAIVTYKGVEITVTGEQEIFDPETQDIIRFRQNYLGYPWGLPDEIDEERFVRRN